MNNPQKICIVRLSALGDIVLHVPMIRTLQKAFPDCTITWVTSPLAYQVLEGLSDVEFIVIKKPHSLSDYWQFRNQMKNRQFDVLIASQASLRANLLYPLIKAPVKIGFDAHRAKDGHSWFINQTIPFAKQHLLDSFLSFAVKIGATDKCIQWDLAIAERDKQWAMDHLPSGPVLAINPTASKTERNWLVERYAEVARCARERWGVNIVLTGGGDAGEQALANMICQQCDFEITNLVGKTNVKQLMAVLSQVDVLLAPDTGPVHIATAFSTPVIGLYAVAPPELSGPYFCQELVINRYPQAVKQYLANDADKVSWSQRVHDNGAMKLITLNDVLEKLAVFFKGTKQKHEDIN